MYETISKIITLSEDKMNSKIDSQNEIISSIKKLLEENSSELLSTASELEQIKSIVSDLNNSNFSSEIEDIKARIDAIKYIKGEPGKDGADGIDGMDGQDGSPDTPEQIKEKLESLKGDARLDKSAIKGLELVMTKPDLDRAVSILDSRTSFLINKVAALSNGGGSLALPITTVLSSGTATYDQTNNFLGLGLSGAGQTFDTGTGGINILASIDTSPFGGSADTTFVGYLNPGGPGANANGQFGYDSVLDEAVIDLNTQNIAGNSARITLFSNATNGNITFSYGGGNSYNFPNTSPSSGEVIGYVSANQLGWVTPTGGLTIGDPITGGTANRVLYENSTNTLQESGDFQFDDSGGKLTVSFAGSNHLYINPTSSQYYMGDGGGTGNTTLIEVLDGIPVIRNWVNGSFLVQRPNAGPSLIDGNTSTFNLYLGDVGGNANKTVIEILDSAQWINISAYSSGSGTGIIKIGDNNNNGNSTMFEIDDSSERIAFSKRIGIPGYTVATLPSSPASGDIVYVTDALAPTYLAVVVGGGAVVTPVFYNGTNWVAF